MGKRTIAQQKKIYRQAIEYMGGETNERMSLKTLKKLWKQERKEQRAQGIELPNVKTVSNQYEYQYEQTQRDEEMNTLPPEEPLTLGTDYVENFIQTITEIYQRTKDDIASAPKNSKGNVKDPKYYFMQNGEALLDLEYKEILDKIETMRITFGDDVLAQALASDTELYYTEALVFMPPSSMVDNFEITIEQLNGIMVNLSAEYMI